MEKFNRWLLKMALVLVVTPAHAQDNLCNDAEKKRAAINWVYNTHPYTRPAFQHALDSLLLICPDWDRAYQQKAMPYIKMGHSAEAYYWLKKAVALNPEYLDYRAFLKCIFTKDYAGALEDFAEAEKLQPGGGLMDHSYRFYVALCQLGLGEFQMAASMLDSIAAAQEARLKTAHFNTYFYQGLAHLLAGHDAIAERVFNKCLSTHQHHPDAHFYLGRILQARGEKEKARQHFEACIAALKEGYNNSEDQEIYIRYPYEVGIRDAEDALAF